MRLLLDTHVFLWAVTANRRLKPSTREFLSRGRRSVCVRRFNLGNRHQGTIGEDRGRRGAFSSLRSTTVDFKNCR